VVQAEASHQEADGEDEGSEQGAAAHAGKMSGVWGKCKKVAGREVLSGKGYWGFGIGDWGETGRREPRMHAGGRG
jgi:hypothetical protein